MSEVKALSLLEAQERMRRAMLRRDKQTLRELTEAYRTAAKMIRRDAERLLDKIARARAAGESVSPFWLSQEARYRSLLVQIEKRIAAFADRASGRITVAQADLIGLGAEDALSLIGLNLPSGVATSFSLLPAQALENLAGFLSDGSPLADLLGELGPEARRMISQTLFTGLAAGTAIRQIARSINRALGQNLTRALMVSRTEALRAYRTASIETYRANQDVVDGWVWLASFSARTCAACLAKHGSIHPNSEPFESHPNCRCAPSPVTKSWRDLGIPIDEPKRDYGDADKWIRSQPAEIQQRIFGKAGYAAYRKKQVTLQDFLGETYHPRWGRGIRVKPLGEILGTERRRAA